MSLKRMTGKKADDEAMLRGQDDLGTLLSDDEWAALGDLLDRPGGPNVDTSIGFLTAVVSVPNMIPSQEWITTAVGERASDRRLGLLLRAFNTISDGLRHETVFCPEADEIQAIEDWCRGYVMGLSLDDDTINDETSVAAFPIYILSGEYPLNAPDDEEPIADEEGWKKTAREDLADAALEVFDVLAPARRRAATNADPVGQQRVTTKVGRNDPCPCGSGKKYKKCHLGQNLRRAT